MHIIFNIMSKYVTQDFFLTYYTKTVWDDLSNFIPQEESY